MVTIFGNFKVSSFTLLILLAIVTHLPWLGFPRQVVFDEVHFGKFVTAYCCTGDRFFDIHPPHAKLLIAGTAYLGGYRGGHTFENIGQSYGNISPIPLRIFPALTGILLVGVIYSLLRKLGASEAASFLGGLILVFDNAVTVQTRIIALDGLLLLGTFGALFAFLMTEKYVGDSNKRWWYFAILSGVLAGLAVGTKFTGLVAIGLVGLLVWWRVAGSRTLSDVLSWIRIALVILASAAMVYMGGWVAHFVLLQNPGSGDAWRVPTFEKPILSSFWRETVELHKIMYRANSGLQAGHSDSSMWWTWPIMETPVFYWQYSSAGNKVGSIYFLGNPIVWWGLSLAFVLGVVTVMLNAFVAAKARHMSLMRRIKDFTGSIGILWVPMIGYAMSFGPLTRVPRALFLYHYLTPLLFTLLFVVLWLDRIGWISNAHITEQPPRYFVLIGVLIALFIIFSPLTYGFLVNPELQQRLFWFDTWR